MTKMERVIKALEARPEHRRDELADAFAALAEAEAAEPGTVFSDEEWAEIEQRRDTFTPADPERVKRVLRP